MPSVYCGVVHLDHQPVNSTHIRLMKTKMSEWTPEATYEWHQEEVGFAQWTRFNTSESKHLTTLPLRNAHNQFYLCGNVRLDNRETLIHTFRLPRDSTVPDEQLILQAYETWGENCPYYLEGDFSFVIWDKKRQQIFAARDILGYKTFYYHWTSQKHFLFATTPHPLVQHPDLPIKLDEVALAHFLVQTMPHPTLTCYENIKKIPPAHFLVLTLSGLRLQRYWDPRNAQAIRYQDKNEYYAHFREVFEQAVTVRLRSDYPIATQLSGGLDSSSVTAVAAHLLQAKNQSLFAMGLVPPTYNRPWRVRKGWSVDDSLYMEEVVASYPNIQWLKITGEENNIFDYLQVHQKYLDVPVRNAYNRLWIEKMCHLTQQMNGRVLLTGQFGNFTISIALRTAPKGLKKWLRDYPLRYIRMIKQKLRSQFPWQEYSPISQSFARHCGDFQDEVPEDIADCINSIPDVGNAYTVFESIFGVECRDPTGDRRVIEFCQGVPLSVFGQSFEKNRLLVREGMESYLPATVRWRTTQGVQVADWYSKFDKELPLLKKALQSLTTSEFNQVLDVKNLNDLLNRWQLPNHETNEPLDRDFFAAYQAKVLRGITAYTFLSQFKQFRQRKELLTQGKKLQWETPRYTEIFR